MLEIVLDMPRNRYRSTHRLAVHSDGCNRWHEFGIKSLERLGFADEPTTSRQFRGAAGADRAAQSYSCANAGSGWAYAGVWH
jgi:hypothetical protein